MYRLFIEESVGTYPARNSFYEDSERLPIERIPIYRMMVPKLQVYQAMIMIALVDSLEKGLLTLPTLTLSLQT